MLKRLLNNWNWKILSLAVAFTLWLIVMNYEDPFITRTFKNVPVVKLNEDAITSQRKAVYYRSGESVELVLEGPRSVMDRYSASDIYAYADLSKVSVTNAVDIEININEKLSIKEQKPLKMEIDLENVITVQKEIQAYYDGEPANGYVKLEPSIEPNVIQITGPESNISRVSKVFASINIDGAKDDLTLYATPLLVDENNEVVQGITMSNTMVEVRVPVQRLKKIGISENLVKTAAPGYGIDDIALDMESVMVRGEDNALAQIDRIVIENFDLGNYTEPTDIQVDLTTFLPEGVYIYGSEGIATVHVDVAPLQQKTLEFTTDDIQVENVPDDLEYVFVTAPDKVFGIIFEGTEKVLDELDLSSVSLILSLRDRPAGTFTLPLEMHLPAVVTVVQDADDVTVRLQKAEADN